MRQARENETEIESKSEREREKEQGKRRQRSRTKEIEREKREMIDELLRAMKCNVLFLYKKTLQEAMSVKI